MLKNNIINSFVSELPADSILENHVRIVQNACYSIVQPTSCSQPILQHLSESLLEELGLNEWKNDTDFLTKLFSGNTIAEGSVPYSMCYGGHQFGQWAGQLGDGRAINLFEVVHQNKMWTLQLKGAGKTPYSRKGDGLAVLRSSIREYLCSEAMYYLGIPTTRALSLVTTGDKVLRDILYNGNEAFEPGAIVCRVAPNFIRFGNFEILAARKETENLKRLADYTISHFFPEILPNTKNTYLDFFENVTQKTIELIIDWLRVGFVHGVMNTDNMSISGLTIDYGPYGWLEDYKPNWTPNLTDHYYKRYSFGNQKEIAMWNLVQLANALFPIINDAPSLEAILHQGLRTIELKYQKMMLSKLGLSEETPFANTFIGELENLMTTSEMDMTLFFRKLSNFKINEIQNFLTEIEQCSYSTAFPTYFEQWQQWLEKYAAHLTQQPNSNRIVEMNSCNPKYVLRNYMAQKAIQEAEKGNFEMVDELYHLLQNPYDEQPEKEQWFAKRPDWAKAQIGSSVLSCSS